MEKQMISKKDLLELKGISYGQLYRWKRKKLLPEEWFIKKSSFTGQETFFPKDDILKRIDMIVELKDKYSLDELADLFSVNSKKVFITKEDLINTRYFTQFTLDFINDVEKLSFSDIASGIILEEFKRSFDISYDKGKEIWGLLNQLDSENKNYYIYLDNDQHILIKEESAEIYYDSGFALKELINSYDCKERLDEILKGLGGQSNG